MIAHPGKKMLFMGCEFGQFREWDYTNQLEWFILQYPKHSMLQNFTAELNRFYLLHPQLWEIDFSWDGFQWLEPDDSARNVLVFRRMALNKSSMIVVCNFSNRKHQNYTFSVLREGYLKAVFNSDWQRFGGESPESNAVYKSEGKKLKIDIPPFTAIFLNYIKADTGGAKNE
jgi:1,4-alpha-glucan branching enzyme